MKKNRGLFTVIAVIAIFSMLLGACGGSTPPATQAPNQPAATQAPNQPAPTEAAKAEPVKLVVLTHWGEESNAVPLKAMLDEYMAANPNVTIEIQAVTFDQLLTKITTARAGGTAPDVIHIYNLWMPDFVKGGALAEPPADIASDIQASYSPGSVEAVTVQGKAWGYPTEVATYQLLYNKKMFAEAGLTEPPKTFAELKDYACKLTKKNADGTLVHTGYALMPGWDSGVVHPYLSMLWSDGGDYLAPDLSKSEFNSPQGQETLQVINDMIKDGCADPGLGGGNMDFVNGKSAMIIMANWLRATLQSSFVDGYENVGVAPIPVGPSGSKSIALQYNWLWSVDATSKHQAEAWKLVKWMNSPRAEGKATPMGEFLLKALGSLPSRTSDQKALSDQLSEYFLKAYVDSTVDAKPEPVLLGGQEIKTKLQTEIEASWYGQKSGNDALKAAAEEADTLLQENK